MPGNAVLVNFSGGETSPKSRGRFDAPWYVSSAKKLVNWIAETQGPARYRPGFKYGRQTRGGAVARIVTFQVNNNRSYQLEFTPLKMRAYFNDQLLTNTTTTVTGVTRATTAVLTVASAAALSNGDEIILVGMKGMLELNDRQVKLANKSGSTFELVDPVTGVGINSTAYGAWTSAGNVEKVYEITTPWSASDLLSLQWAGNNTTMYFVCPTQAPQKLTVDITNIFTLGPFVRTNDPFANSGGVLTVSGITLGAQTIVSFASGSVVLSGVDYDFAGVVGTVQINGGTYRLVSITGNYQVVLTLGGTAGGEAVDGVSIAIAAINGVLGTQLTGTTAYVKVLGTNTGLSVVALYSDVGLTTPIVYNGTLNGNFDTYIPTGNGTLTSGAHSGDAFTIYEAAALFTLPTAYLKTAAGADVDSSAWTVYVSGGTATPHSENPIAVAFYEGRLGYFGTNQRPASMFLSRAPDDQGNSRYDDFTGGSQADFACFFQLAPAGGSVDYISWARGGPDYLFIGTFGGPFRVSGSGLDIPITPSSINVRQFDTAGAEETMAAGCAQIFFIQRGGTTLRAVKVINPYLATFESVDLCLNAEQIMYSPLQRVALAQGRPDILWVVREDGILSGLSVHVTVEKAETISGWHRHQLGGVDSKVLDIAVAQRTTSIDRLWAVTERVVNGVTRRFVEYLTDEIAFPDPEDFYTQDAATDKETFDNVLYRLQENYVHMDAAATYNGSARGVTAGATLTPGAVTGTAVTFTAGAAVFAATDVGAELWKKPDAATGVGSGRAVITAYTSPTVVTAEIQVDFDSVVAIPAGDWYFAVKNIYGLSHLEGVAVGVVVDGAVYAEAGLTGESSYPTVTPANAKIALTNAAAVVHVGLPYAGYLESHNLEIGGQTGPAQDKPRNISEMYIRFMNSLGVQFGTDLYKMQAIDHRLSDATFDRPAPVFSGIRRLTYEDTSSGLEDMTREKQVFVAQRLPLPAIVQFIDMRYDTSDGG